MFRDVNEEEHISLQAFTKLMGYSHCRQPQCVHNPVNKTKQNNLGDRSVDIPDASDL
jgi:hypothetical protein